MSSGVGNSIKQSTSKVSLPPLLLKKREKLCPCSCMYVCAVGENSSDHRAKHREEILTTLMNH
jgi:hypothetical protein